MTIATVHAAFQSKLAAISGITMAPVRQPASIQSVDLPMAITRPGTCSWSQGSFGKKQQIRNWEVTVYVQAIYQGQPIEQGYAATLPILEAVGEAFLDDPTLSDAVDTLQIQEDQMTDSGVLGDLTFFGGTVFYHGFTMTIPVKERYT